MCGDCFVCIYLVCQCDGLELGRRNRQIAVRGVAVRINNMGKGYGDLVDSGANGGLVGDDILLLETDPHSVRRRCSDPTN